MAVNDIVMSAAGASGPATFVEDIFSTFLYTGTGSAQTITNNIDLSGKGGLIWLKSRSNTGSNILFDTVRGADNLLRTNRIDEQNNAVGYMTTFNSNGFGLTGSIPSNASGQTFASWTFREQSKFFDIVTYTGNGSNRTIAHDLGSVPGCIIIKNMTTYGTNWQVYHNGLTSAAYSIQLNNTAAQASAPTVWNSTAPTSTVFSVGTSSDTNENGSTFVAYLFAHNAGGFGATGTDNVISCGSFVTDGNGDGSINLGYEPQWLLAKDATGVGGWYLLDNMRGLPAGSFTDALLSANLSDAEAATNVAKINATGASFTNYGSSRTIIYIAIRRPMKTPTTGTEVFSPVAYTGTGTNDRQIGASTFVNDFILGTKRNTIDGKYFYTRLQGNGTYLNSTSTSAEGGVGDTTYGPQYNKIQFGYQQGSGDAYNLNNSGDTFINYLFRRAPGFFDEVCYTGTGVVGQTYIHNLTVAPEMMIVKRRSASANWAVYHQALGNNKYIRLNLDFASSIDTDVWATTSPTASVFSVGDFPPTNASGGTYVAYLFATVAGVSKVGSYTGNGSSQTINCGFTTGARFFLVKATSTTGNWWVYDSARGIISSNDPALALNSTAAEVTSADAVDADSSGIIVNQEATCSINASGVSYIFLAIA